MHIQFTIARRDETGAWPMVVWICKPDEYAKLNPNYIKMSEKNIEFYLVRHLQKEGHWAERQVTTAAGRADVVSDEAVYEVEHYLTRQKFFEAVGQVLLYREAVNPNLRAVIVGKMMNESLPLVQFANSLGIEVLTWDC